MINMEYELANLVRNYYEIDMDLDYDDYISEKYHGASRCPGCLSHVLHEHEHYEPVCVEWILSKVHDS